jgi:PAS domain S-box-containing protein
MIDTNKSEADILKLLNELQVQKEELRVQNEALQISENKYRMLVENSPDAIAIYRDRKVVFANSECLRLMSAHSMTDLIGKSLVEFVHPDFREFVIDRMKKASIPGTILPIAEEKFIVLDGSEIDVEVKAISIIFENKPAVQLIIRDITERRQTEIKLIESEERYKRITEGLTDYLYTVIIKNGKVVKTLHNESCKAVTGYSSKEFLNDPHLWINMILPNERELVTDRFEKIINSENLPPTEYRIKCKNGKIRWVRDTTIPKYNLKGKLIAYDGVIKDITDQKQTEENVKLKNNELLLAIAEKDKFFSIIAHDLRNPFNVFLGYTQIMAEELNSLSTEEVQKIAVSMRTSATNLFHLLENLLEWSRFQRGVTGFNPKSFLFMPKVAECLESVLESANKKGIEICFEIPNDLVLFADGNMVESIVRNLTNNAVKFTSKGGTIYLSAKPVSENYVEISVKDTGIGMNKDILDNLFRFCENAKRFGTNGEPSTGLGLIICKEFVEKNNGKITVESESGVGSTFKFTLPSS